MVEVVFIWFSFQSSLHVFLKHNTEKENHQSDKKFGPVLHGKVTSAVHRKMFMGLCDTCLISIRSGKDYDNDADDSDER